MAIANNINMHYLPEAGERERERQGERWQRESVRGRECVCCMLCIVRGCCGCMSLQLAITVNVKFAQA